jgi:hypothetical protein
VNTRCSYEQERATPKPRERAFRRLRRLRRAERAKEEAARQANSEEKKARQREKKADVLKLGGVRYREKRSKCRVRSTVARKAERSGETAAAPFDCVCTLKDVQSP